ncbi:TMV resistance protein N-like [Solanum tuberosum]|uniref:TMV resistance protein N-like n=1 Tax=Solanum tuberosum TaxID=4113 RepID=UPI00073A43EA|nr:PREDICTED: TMV resistance protein N-like [Solanum tuberosum]
MDQETLFVGENIINRSTVKHAKGLIRYILVLKLSNLKHLDLMDSCELRKTPNFGDMPNLETLNLHGCVNLEEVHPSFGHCRLLTYLSLEGCRKLKKLPKFVCVESLETLNLLECTNLQEFPEICGDMPRLSILYVKSPWIRSLPTSFSSLRNLQLTECEVLESCEELLSLPDSLCNLMKLRCLYLDGCKKLEKLPENIGDLQDLHVFDASETAISQPPPSITKLGLSSLTSLDPNNHNTLSGLPEDLGSLHSLENLNVSGSNISCLPKSFKGLLHLQLLNVQFCQNLNELPVELPPNLRELFADYHLALKSSKNLVICCLKLCRLAIADYGTVSSEQVNVFLQHFLRTCIQCDFHQRACFIISFPAIRIPELFDYDRFINQNEISIELNPSWYTDKFMGFWISYGPTRLDARLEATLVCKSDPERKYSLEYNYIPEYSRFEYPFICCAYILFETLWHASDNV